jgi:hypothetical protein
LSVYTVKNEATNEGSVTNTDRLVIGDQNKFVDVGVPNIVIQGSVSNDLEDIGDVLKLISVCGLPSVDEVFIDFVIEEGQSCATKFVFSLEHKL